MSEHSPQQGIFSHPLRLSHSSFEYLKKYLKNKLGLPLYEETHVKQDQF